VSSAAVRPADANISRPIPKRYARPRRPV